MTGKPPSVEEDWINPGADPFLTDWNSAAARRDAHKREKPQLGSKEYDLPAWQKALMVGTNAAAGYVNAAGRTRVAPIDQKTLMHRPKYDQAMDAWETEGRALDSELGSLQQQYALKRQGEQDERANKLSKRQNMIADAQIEDLTARAEQRRKAATAPPTKRTNIYAADRWGTINTETGEYVQPPSWAQKPPPEKKEFNQTLEDAALEGLTGADRAAEAKRLLAMKQAKKGGGGAGGLTPAQKADDDRADAARAAALDHQNRQEVAKLEEEENYRMGQGADKGIHERLGELGPLLTPPTDKDELKNWTRADANVAEFIRLNNRLKSIYGRKLELNALKGGRAEYEAMIQGINKNLARLTQRGGTAAESAGAGPTASQLGTSRGAGPTIPQQGASRVTPGKTQQTRPPIGSIITR
jgi:hypothetical protein